VIAARNSVAAVLARAAALGAGLLLLAAAGHADKTVTLSTSGEARIGAMAPSFGLWGVAGDGPFVLEKLRKQPAPAPLLITFGASWCPPCRAGLPRLKALADKHPELRLVLIDVETDVSAAQAWIKEVGLQGPTLLDKFEVAARLYGAAAANKSSLPRTFLVDARGRVRAIYSVEGADLEAVIEDDLRAALAAAAAPPEPPRAAPAKAAPSAATPDTPTGAAPTATPAATSAMPATATPTAPAATSAEAPAGSEK
jgi:thiol-disulfide isomerase/thioredoxin